MLLAGGAVEGAGVGRAVPVGGASGEGVAGGWDDGDGLFGEQIGARGFDCPPDRAHLYEDDGAF